MLVPCSVAFKGREQEEYEHQEQTESLLFLSIYIKSKANTMKPIDFLTLDETVIPDEGDTPIWKTLRINNFVN